MNYLIIKFILVFILSSTFAFSQMSGDSTINPVTGEIDKTGITEVNWEEGTVDNMTGINWADLGGSGTLDTVTDAGATTTNRITTGSHTVTDDGSAKLIVNAVPDENYGSGGDTIGNFTIDGQLYRVHKFTTLGASTFVAPTARTLRVLVVAGGGGGGRQVGGGGGGGGLIETTISATNGQSFPITVGDGGISNTNGQDSVIGILIAKGGGKGGGYGIEALSGGSGGGGNDAEVGGSGLGANPLGSQGNKGGNGGNNPRFYAGGGGGAGSVGGNYTAGTIAGVGGAGLPSNISGSTLYYAGGGGGGSYQGTPAKGTDGGGNGSTAGGGAGTANTGGGGGGGGYPTTTGGKGGSGIVIVAYPINSGAISASPEINFNGSGFPIWSIKNDGDDNNKLKTYNASGTVVSALDQSGNQIFAGTIKSTSTGDIGWSVVAGANTACNTTCTNACVIGLDQGALGTVLASFVNCASALADQCLCAGAN